jgi:hypothetical protein
MKRDEIECVESAKTHPTPSLIEGGGKSAMSARLVRYGWLRRTVEFTLSDQLHVLEYNARGVWERVTVDGVVIRKFSCSWHWIVPRFEFRIGEWEEWPGVVEVRAWPWGCLRSFVVRVDNQVIYAERSSLRFTLRWMMVAVAIVALGLGLGIPAMDRLNPFRPNYKKAAEYYARRARTATDPQEKAEAQAKADSYAECSRRIFAPIFGPPNEILDGSFDNHK